MSALWAVAAAHGHRGLLGSLRHRLALGDVDIPLLAVVESLAGALCYAASTLLQQSAAREQDAELSMRPGLLLRLARSGRWMLGTVLDVAGFGFQFLALRRAALALVVPLFVVGLVVSIIGAALLAHRRPGRAEVSASLLVVSGLGLFIAIAQPGPGHPRASAAGWVGLFVVTGAVVGGCVLGARHVPRWRALLLGAGCGILYGVTSSLTERTGRELNGGVVHTLLTWAPYALAVVSILGLLLNQSAYQAGDLRHSLPVLTVAEPVVAILVGQVLFGEHIASSAGARFGEVAGLAAMSVGVVVLGRLALPERVEAELAAT